MECMDLLFMMVARQLLGYYFAHSVVKVIKDNMILKTSKKNSS